MSTTKKRPAIRTAKAGRRGQNRCSAETISDKQSDRNGRIYGSRIYGSRPTKRRTQAEIAVIRDAVIDELQAQSPMSARQLYYRLVAAGAIAKTEGDYKGVIRLLKLMRADGSVSYHHIVDNTRWMRKPETYGDLRGFLDAGAQCYRRALWHGQPAYVELWCEKDALSGVLYPITSEFDVPLMSTRGFPSLSFLYSAAETISEKDKQVYIYYIGDHDPSGASIAANVEHRLREFSGSETELHFEQIAVTPEQIEELQLPTRPTKKTDSRSARFVGESVEADAIEPDVLRALVRSKIEQHIDQDVLERTRLIEQRERETLEDLSFDYEPTAGDEDDD